MVRRMRDPYDVQEVHAKTACFSYYGLPVTRGLYLTFILPFHAAGLPCHYMSLENLTADFSGEFRRLLTFLELDADIALPAPEPYNRANAITPVPETIAGELSAFYRPFNQRLFDFLGKAYDWS